MARAHGTPSRATGPGVVRRPILPTELASVAGRRPGVCTPGVRTCQGQRVRRSLRFSRLARSQWVQESEALLA